MKRLLFSFGLLSFALGALVFDLANVRSIIMATTSGWAINGDDVYFSDGKVGIGTNSPEELVHVAQTPTNITLLSEVYNGDGEFSKLYPGYLDISNNIMYVAAVNAVAIIDMSDPTDPDLLTEIYDGDGTYSNLNGIKAIDEEDGYLYVVSTDNNGSLTIIDVSDPANPTLESESYDGDGTFNYLNNPSDISVQGNYAYISSHSESRISIANSV